MDAEITPEPTQEEREALLRVLVTLDGAPAGPSAWWQAGVRDALDDDGDD